MSKYFSIEELCKTDTGLDNTPNEEQLEHLEELIEVLDGIREEWGSAIRVNSGFRTNKVNKAVKGSKSSAHCLGYAADIFPCNKDMKKFQKFVPNYLQENDIEFDQLIFEKPKNGISSWLHIGIRNGKGEQRKQIFTLI